MNLNRVGTLSLKVEVDTSGVKSGLDAVRRDAEVSGRQLADDYSDKVGRGGKEAGEKLADGVDDGLDKARTQAGRSGEEAASRFSGGFSKVKAGIDKAVLPAVGVLTGLAAGAWDATQSASDLAESQSKVNVVFGAGAPAIQEWAKNAPAAMGQSSKDALDAAANMAALGKAADLSGSQLAGFSTSMVGLSGDLASFYNSSPADTMQAISAGLRGEAEPMRRYGVLLDQASLQAKAFSMGLVQAQGDTTKIATAQLSATRAASDYAKAVSEYGQESSQARDKAAALEIAQMRLKSATEGTVPQLNNQQKILAAQALILDQTKDAQGDFARTSDGMANSQRTMTAELENAKAALGQGLLPILTPVVKQLSSMAHWASENTGTVKVLAVVVGSLAGAILAAKAAITVYEVATKVAAAAQWVWNVAMDANPIGVIIMAIAALVAGIIWAYQNVDWFREGIDAAFSWIADAWSWIVDAAKAVWDWLSENWPLVIAIITGPMGIAVKFILDHWEQIKAFFSNLPGYLLEAGKTLVNAITWPWRTGVNLVIGILNGLVNWWNGMSLGIPAIDTPWGQHFDGLSISPPDLPTLPTIPALANGGVVTRPTLALIGEAGPEAVVPLGRAGGMGTTVNVNVNIAPGGVGDPRTIKEAARQAVQETLRGGALRLVAAGR